jgi:hypothetical protein
VTVFGLIAAIQLGQCDGSKGSLFACRLTDVVVPKADFGICK